jgi:hypothetical protein
MQAGSPMAGLCDQRRTPVHADHPARVLHQVGQCAYVFAGPAAHIQKMMAGLHVEQRKGVALPRLVIGPGISQVQMVDKSARISRSINVGPSRHKIVLHHAAASCSPSLGGGGEITLHLSVLRWLYSLLRRQRARLCYITGS